MDARKRGRDCRVDRDWSLIEVSPLLPLIQPCLDFDLLDLRLRHSDAQEIIVGPLQVEREGLHPDHRKLLPVRRVHFFCEKVAQVGDQFCALALRGR